MMTKAQRNKIISAALHLKEHDHIVTAWPESVSGPGWANRLIWVLVQDGNGKLRRECLQPDEQTSEMLSLFAVAAAASNAITTAVKATIIEEAGYDMWKNL